MLKGSYMVVPRALCVEAAESLQYYCEETCDQGRLDMARQAEAAIGQAIGFFAHQLGL